MLDETYEVDHKMDLQYGGTNHVAIYSLLVQHVTEKKQCKNIYTKFRGFIILYFNINKI